MQSIVTTIDPAYRIDIAAKEGERLINLSATRVSDEEQSTTLSLNSFAVGPLMQDLVREVHYQTRSDELMNVDDWSLHQEPGAEVLHLNIVGSNALVQHVQLTDADAWNLYRALDGAFDIFRAATYRKH